MKRRRGVWLARAAETGLSCSRTFPRLGAAVAGDRRAQCFAQCSGRRRTSRSSRPSPSASASTPYRAAWSASVPVNSVLSSSAWSCSPGNAQRIVSPRRPRTRIWYRCGRASRLRSVMCPRTREPARCSLAVSAAMIGWPLAPPVVPVCDCKHRPQRDERSSPRQCDRRRVIHLTAQLTPLAGRVTSFSVARTTPCHSAGPVATERLWCGL
jgi:hypothetical protein